MKIPGAEVLGLLKVAETVRAEVFLFHHEVMVRFRVCQWVFSIPCSNFCSARGNEVLMSSHPSWIFLALLGTVLIINIMLLNQPEPSVLFIQEAFDGSFVPANDGDPSEFVLTLNTISPIGVFLTDQLNLPTGRIRTTNFIRIEGLFEKEDPPHAVILLLNAEDENQDVLSVKLYNPRHDPEQQRLTYDAIVTDDVHTKGFESWRSRLDNSLPESFGRVRLIIDRLSFELENIIWTIEIVDGSGNAVPDIEFSLNFTTLAGEEQSRTRTTDSSGIVRFAIPSTFNLEALLSYSVSLDSEAQSEVYTVPITARCSGSFRIEYGRIFAEGETLTLPCPIGSSVQQ